MKELINGWKITNHIGDSNNFIVVLNYSIFKEVQNCGLYCKIKKYGIESRIGIWQPKGTKEKELKSK